MATMKEYPYAKDLKVGDVVCTISSYRMNLGLFAGFGNGTFQIYEPWSVYRWKNLQENYNSKISRPHVTYTKAYEENIVKVDVNGLSDEKKKEIEGAKQILIEHKLVKNYEQ